MVAVAAKGLAVGCILVLYFDLPPWKNDSVEFFLVNSFQKSLFMSVSAFLLISARKHLNFPAGAVIFVFFFFLAFLELFGKAPS